MRVYRTIGVMSGTSLDGVDIAYVEFFKESKNWRFQMGPYISIPFDNDWKTILGQLTKGSALDYVKADSDFGHFLGRYIADFIKAKNLKIDLIATHGHTIFHQPENAFTSQIGDGSAIVAETGFPVVCDFRSLDVARGGQGAPLVPIGDTMLFHDYKARVNLGGFSNVSIGGIDELSAFDICPLNIVLNPLAQRLGQDYDKDGHIARGGQIIEELLVQLNQLDFYKQSGPKSLGVEWVEREVFPLLSSSQKVEDLLRTFAEHAAYQISDTLNKSCSGLDKVLFTGGGVFNIFLMERIEELTNAQIEIPSTDIIEMKEAIVFAFLGLLRFLGEENILSTYTGANKNSVSGALYLP